MELTRTQSPYRRLVSLRRVSRIKELDSSQTHEVVMIDGWPVVVEKGQFAVKQTVLYFAIDCVLPLEDKRYKPYRFSHFLVELRGQKGWTVQTVKHEGHVSQGMVFAIGDSFPEVVRIRKESEGRSWLKKVEDYVMELELKKHFKVRKWSPYYPRDGGVNLGRSPSFLPATKSERVQNIPDLWKTHGGTEFQITEILVGVPMIFYDISENLYGHDSQLPGVILDDEAENGMRCRLEYGVTNGGHDHEETEASISWKAARAQKIVDNFVEATDGIGLAGVLCGEGILGNPHMIKGRRFSTYAVCDDKFETWKTTDDYDDKWHTLSSLEFVPKFSTRVRLSAFAKDLDELMKKAQGASCVSEATRAKYPSLKRKGLAFRALDGSFSFKVIANDWLLDETEKLRKAGQDKIVSRPGPDEMKRLD